MRGPRSPSGSTLDRVAPTLNEILDVPWRFPDVHAGPAHHRPRGRAAGLAWCWRSCGPAEARAELGPTRPPPRPGDGSRRHGAVASTEATTGSLPLDPVAVLTTIGTGGPPSQHGITGGLIRDEGEVIRPWSAGAPTSVIAALPDDLVAHDPSDEGRRRPAGGGGPRARGRHLVRHRRRRGGRDRAAAPGAGGRRDARRRIRSRRHPRRPGRGDRGPRTNLRARPRDHRAPRARGRPGDHGRPGRDRRALPRRRRHRLRRRGPRELERVGPPPRSSRP